MLLQKETVSQLKDIGLNSYEAKLWLALLAKGVASAGELSDIANVPRSRSYDVLESLEKKGFIIMKIGKPIKYIAVQPDHVISNVRKRMLEDVKNQEKFLDKVERSELIGELKNVYKSGITDIDPTELTGSIKGRKNIYRQIERLIKNAEKSVIIVTTSEGIQRKKSALKGAIRKAKENKVSVKVAASDVDGETIPQLEELSRFCELRISNTPARFCVIDGKDVIFMPLGEDVPNPEADIGVWVQSKFFAATFEKMFEAAWPEMKTIF
jgi:HTH-type transcriptional regulator, sugar sensing transcriptional regulator